MSDTDIIFKQAEAEKACITGFDANCPENVSRGILWPKRVGIITSLCNLQDMTQIYKYNFCACLT